MGNLDTEGTSRRKLIRCKACGGEISRTAHVCPHCGHSKTRWLRAIVIALVIVWTLFHEEIHEVLIIPDPVDFILHRLQKLFVG
jgi:uncharacterized OB-fold protein